MTSAAMVMRAVMVMSTAMVMRAVMVMSTAMIMSGNDDQCSNGYESSNGDKRNNVTRFFKNLIYNVEGSTFRVDGTALLRVGHLSCTTMNMRMVHTCVLYV